METSPTLSDAETQEQSKQKDAYWEYSSRKWLSNKTKKPNQHYKYCCSHSGCKNTRVLHSEREFKEHLTIYSLFCLEHKPKLKKK
jgi:hypothetical protein